MPSPFLLSPTLLYFVLISNWDNYAAPHCCSQWFLMLPAFFPFMMLSWICEKSKRTPNHYTWNETAEIPRVFCTSSMQHARMTYGYPDFLDFGSGRSSDMKWVFIFKAKATAGLRYVTNPRFKVTTHAVEDLEITQIWARVWRGEGPYFGNPRLRDICKADLDVNECPIQEAGTQESSSSGGQETRSSGGQGAHRDDDEHPHAPSSTCEESESESEQEPPETPGPPTKFHQEWYCGECSYKNFSYRALCRLCWVERKETKSGRAADPYLPGDWVCFNCWNHNYAARAVCNRKKCKWWLTRKWLVCSSDGWNAQDV